VRQVIADTSVPSWVTHVPKNFCEACAGGWKADEARTLATIYLPITLVLLWGTASNHPDLSEDLRLKRRALLDHTMLLVEAIVLLFSRKTSRRVASLHRQYMQQYIGGLKKLYPRSTYKPIHHAAMHTYDFLILFGPVASWWCFPFERLIWHIQQMNRNNKYGELFRFVRWYNCESCE